MTLVLADALMPGSAPFELNAYLAEAHKARKMECVSKSRAAMEEFLHYKRYAK